MNLKVAAVDVRFNEEIRSVRLTDEKFFTQEEEEKKPTPSDELDFIHRVSQCPCR